MAAMLLIILIIILIIILTSTRCIGIHRERFQGSAEPIFSVNYASLITEDPVLVLTMGDVVSEPTVTYFSGSPTVGQLYTILMYDPDAPTITGKANWLHWLVVNIPGTSAGDKILHPNLGVTRAKYIGPSPPPGTGNHRYIIQLYRQLGKIPTNWINNRSNFALDQFVADQSLSLINGIKYIVKG